MMQELMTPATHWIVVSAEGGTIIFTDREGRSARYVPDGKPEKHQWTSATVETKTRWEEGQLRQELSLPGGIKAVRLFAVKPDTNQLVVTTTTAGGPDGGSGSRPPLQFVYDRDEAER